MRDFTFKTPAELAERLEVVSSKLNENGYELIFTGKSLRVKDRNDNYITDGLGMNIDELELLCEHNFNYCCGDDVIITLNDTKVNDPDNYKEFKEYIGKKGVIDYTWCHAGKLCSTICIQIDKDNNVVLALWYDDFITVK